MCMSCGFIARTRVCKLSDPCSNTPTGAGKANLNAFAAGKAPINCHGWPFKEQFQKPFKYVQPDGTADKESIQAIARVQDQCAAIAAAQREMPTLVSTLPDESHSDSEDSVLESQPKPVSHSLNTHSMDDPDWDQSESEDPYLATTAYSSAVSPPPDDWWLPDEVVYSDSD